MSDGEVLTIGALLALMPALVVLALLILRVPVDEEPELATRYARSNGSAVSEDTRRVDNRTREPYPGPLTGFP